MISNGASPEPGAQPGDRILIVDDEARVRRSLSRMLETAGYDCASADSVQEARQLLNEREFELVICDMRMPEESGMALIEEIEAADKETAMLMATGVDDPSIAQAVTRHGVQGYLVKPFSRNELLINVDSAIEQARSRHEELRESERLRREADARAESVRHAMVDVAEQEKMIDEQRTQMLIRLSDAVGRRDLETGGHIRRIGEYSALLGKTAGLPSSEVQQIRLAAPMHDVGKIAIPDAILLKPGALDPEEREVMERHAKIGYDVLADSGSPLLDVAAEIALSHHEWMDGNGYPRGLAGEEIPLVGRLVAVVDVFDALVSERPYRPPMPLEVAIEVMHEESGNHLDSRLVDLFLDLVDRASVPSATVPPDGTPVS
jgi:putative two-component system response regulator